MRRYNANILTGRQLGGLLRRHHDVAIVGQDDDFIDGHSLNLLEKIICAGVHGLSAGDECPSTVSGEDLSQTITIGDSDDGD